MPVQSICMGIFYAVSLFNRLYGRLYRSDNLAEIYTKTTVDKDSSSKSGSDDLKVSTIDLKGFLSGEIAYAI